MGSWSRDHPSCLLESPLRNIEVAQAYLKPGMASRGQCVQDADLQKDGPICAILGGAADIFKIRVLSEALRRSSDGSSACTTPARNILV